MCVCHVWGSGDFQLLISNLPGNRATAQGEGDRIDLQAIAHRCGQKSKYDTRMYPNQSNLTTNEAL